MTDVEIIDAIIEREGEAFVNDPLDGGGPTRFGVTLATLANWRGHSVTAEDVQHLERPEAEQILSSIYLKPFATAPQELKPHLVDMAVHHGVGTARTLWLRSGGSAVRLVKERILYIGRITKFKPTRVRFLGGWLSRALSFLPE